MKITIDSALGGAGFAMVVYVVALIVSILVAGIISLTSHFILKGNPEASPPMNEK